MWNSMPTWTCTMMTGWHEKSKLAQTHRKSFYYRCVKTGSRVADHPTSSSVTADSNVVELCRLDEIPDRTAKGFDPFTEGRDAVFVLRWGDRLKAYRNRCPHQGASLPWRKNAYLNADRTRIVCHAHGAQFDIDTGECVLGPALGRSLEPVEISVTGAGAVPALLPRKGETTCDN